METNSRLISVFLVLILVSVTSYSIAETLNISPNFTIATNIANPITSEMPGKSALGFDGTNYLLVSCRADFASTNIFGVQISIDGEILNTFPIANINPVYGCTNQRPSVAFDGTNYLVVFSRVTENGSTEIAGTLVSPSGTVNNGLEGFSIISDVSDAPDVAFDGSNYLVVSAKYNDNTLHDIYGARVNTDGHVLGEFLIFSAQGGQVMSSIAFDGSNYLVIWSDTRSGSPVGPDADIYGARVAPTGTVLDPEGIPISTAQGAQEWPRIIFDGKNYFAVWEDTRNGPEVFPPVLDIFGTRITPAGVVLDGNTDTGGIAINTHPLPQQHPIASFDGKNYVVAWEMSFFYDPPVGIYAARVSTDGFLLDGPPDAGGILISQPSAYASIFDWPNLFSSNKNLLLNWNNNSLEGEDILGVLISPNVLRIGPWLMLLLD
jgi:hypothetical protein